MQCDQIQCKFYEISSDIMQAHALLFQFNVSSYNVKLKLILNQFCLSDINNKFSTINNPLDNEHKIFFMQR